MRPPEKFRTATRFCAAHQRYEGRKPEPRAYVQGLDVRTISGRRRDIFLDILFIECQSGVSDTNHCECHTSGILPSCFLIVSMGSPKARTDSNSASPYLSIVK